MNQQNPRIPTNSSTIPDSIQNNYSTNMSIKVPATNMQDPNSVSSQVAGIDYSLYIKQSSNPSTVQLPRTPNPTNQNPMNPPNIQNLQNLLAQPLFNSLSANILKNPQIYNLIHQQSTNSQSNITNSSQSANNQTKKKSNRASPSKTTSTQPNPLIPPTDFQIPPYLIQSLLNGSKVVQQPSTPETNSIISPNYPNPVQLQKPEFEIEGIVQEREVRGKRQYLVQWEGFSDDENTWEDEANLGRYCHLVNEFRQKGPHSRQSRQRIKDFISYSKNNGKLIYNVLYQNSEIGTISQLQARGNRNKQQLINFLLREVENNIEERERVELPPRPKPVREKKKEKNDDPEPTQYEYEYESCYEEEEEEEKAES